MLKVKMLKFRYFICSLLAMCFFSPFIYANEQQSSLLVTIKPLYLLVKPIIGNHIQVDLLLDGKQSPHDLQLTPNMARKLNQASHIVMIDPYFELFLSKHTEISEGKKIWMASDAPDLGFLALRGTHDHGHAHEQHDEHAHEEHDEHAHEQHDEHAHEEHDEHAHEDEAHEEHAHEEHDEHDDQARNLDYHLWLDMNNAVKMARWLNSKLGEAYPEYANEFNQNTAKLIAEIQSAQQVAASRLAPIKDKPFLVFHDGFQYFEQENGLNMQGVVFEDGSENLSLKNILELKKIIKANAIECVFDEPQYDPSIISSLKDQFELRSATLDSLAANMNLAQLDEFAGYPNLILNMVDAYLSCLNA